nr:MAG TPA: tail tape measure protein [Caudoviricetes sp.]
MGSGKSAILAVKILGDAQGAVKAIKETEDAGGGLFSKITGGIPSFAMIGTAAVGAAAAAGKALYGIGEAFDEVEDTIRVGTGATGDALNGLVDDAHAVATSIPTSFADAGKMVADLNTRLGLSGDQLQTVSKQYLEAGRILGEDVDVNTTTAAFHAFNLENDQVSDAMDNLFRVSQATGVGINDLAGKMTAGAETLNNLGFSFEEGAALIGALDKAGVDSAATLGVMKKGMLAVAKPGEDMQEAFFRVTREIEEFTKRGDTAGALDLAGKVFGTKGAAQMVQAIKSGAINIDDLMGKIGATGDSILQVGEETQDAAEKWTILKNRGMEALRPLAEGAFSLVGDALGKLMDFIDGLDFTPVTSAFQAAAPWITSTAENIMTLGASVMNMVSSVWSFVQPILMQFAPFVTSIIDTIKTYIGDLITVVQNVVSFVTAIFNGNWSGAWEAAKNVVWSAISLVSNIISNLWNVASNYFTGIKNVIVNLWSSAWDFVKTAASNGASALWNTISGIPGQILSALGNVGSLLYNVGRDIIQGLINGIKNMAGALWNGIKSTVSGAVDGIKNFLGIHSPSRVFMEIGEYSGAGLVLGLEKKKNAVHKAYTDLAAVPDPAEFAIPNPAFIGGPGSANDRNAGVTINITVNGALDADATAREIQRVLQRANWRNQGVRL